MLQIKVYQSGELIQTKQCVNNKEADKFLKNVHKQRMLLFGREGKKVLSWKNGIWNYVYKGGIRCPREPYTEVKRVREIANTQGPLKVEIEAI